jgi:protein SCO1/2
MKIRNLAPFLFVAVAGLGVAVFAALKAGEAYMNRKPAAHKSDIPANPSLEPMWDAPAFALTDQEGRPTSDRALRGHVWISDFIFTGCAGSCPMMTAKMANLQKAINDPGVKLVSFSVDPDHDTPAGLKAYGEKYGADFARWSFLSSPGRQAIWDVAKGMKIATGQADAQDQLLHSDSFLLTDATGHVRGVYDSSSDTAMMRLAADAARLSR